MGKRKLVIIIVAILISLIAGYKIFFPKKNGYVLGTVQKRTITEIVTETGIVVTNGQVKIYSPTTGIVSAVYVQNGDLVSQNQKLFSVKSTATPVEKAAALSALKVAKSAVQQAENNRRSTQAAVDHVHDDLKNNDKDETFAEKDERTTAEVANDNAYDALISARAQLASAETAFQATQNSHVTAHLAGEISNLAIVKGSTVTTYSLLAPTNPALIIGGLGETEIQVLVGESDINRVQVGQKVAINLDAIEDKTYSGIVKRVDSSGTITQGVVKFSVYIEIFDSDTHLKPGMSADVDITTSQLSDVLSVPNAAIKPYQKGRAVRILKAGKLEYLPVKIGIRGKEFTQVIEGVSENQSIVVSTSNELTPRKSSFGF